MKHRYDAVLWWGHGTDGKLQWGPNLKKSEYLYYDYIYKISLTRKKSGLPKIKVFQVRCCFVMSDPRMVNALLEIADRVEGYEGWTIDPKTGVPGRMRTYTKRLLIPPGKHHVTPDRADNYIKPKGP